jgi:hypothetical protein
MATRLEVGAQVVVIVDLAILNEDERPVLVLERLLAALDVDDAQTPMAQSNVVHMEVPGSVRAAMAQGIRHPLKKAILLDTDESANPAHGRDRSA